MNIELVVFDMAGTTIEEKGQVLTAFETALGANEIAFSHDELKKWRGASKREVLRVFVERQFGCHHPNNPERIDRAYGHFRQLLEEAYTADSVHPVDGAESAFDWLRGRGIKIALTTGFYRKVTDKILQIVGWDNGKIDAGVCSEDVTRGRPAPFMIFRAMEATGVIDVRRVVTVGDTSLDLQAGANAGVRGVVGVLSGAHGVEQLSQVEHTHIIQSVSELPALIESAFP